MINAAWSKLDYFMVATIFLWMPKKIFFLPILQFIVYQISLSEIKSKKYIYF